MKVVMKEVYIVKFGCADLHAKNESDAIPDKMDILRRSLKASKEGYVHYAGESYLHPNREWIVIQDDELSRNKTELVYPHYALMPESFLEDIERRWEPEYVANEELGNSIKTLCDNLVNWGWNPRLATESPCRKSMYLSNGAVVSLPPILWEFWENYKSANNIDPVDNNYHKYLDWANNLQEKWPEFSIESWDKEETKSIWQSIR